MNEGNARGQIVPSLPNRLSKQTSGLVRRGLQDLDSLASQRILVADHNPPILEVVKAILEVEGYNVRTVDSSDSALGQGPLFAPHLLIIDPVMPAISGVEVARRLAATTKCKVLFLTSLALDSTLKEVVRFLNNERCYSDALWKPFEKKELLDQVRLALGHRMRTASSLIEPSANSAEHERVGSFEELLKLDPRTVKSIRVLKKT
jgi:DNA-binding response OmpR family regulator